MATQDLNTTLGHNRTGLATSPLHDELLTDAENPSGPLPESALMNPEGTLLAEFRRDYVNEADALGSIPPPATAKGMAKSGVGALKNQRVHVFIDKLAERLAFERGGARLYEAALVKALAQAEGTPVNIARMKEIRRQELEHAKLLQETIMALG